MYLIDDIDGVLTGLRRDTYLIEDGLDILDGVVRRRIEFVNIPLRTGFVVVDGACEDTCAGGFSHSSWSTKQIRMRQMILVNRILQRLC